MGKIVMPKNSALLNEVEAVLKIYYEEGDWLSNEEYKTRLKRLIGDDQYASSYTKKAQITSYFGFTEWQDINDVRSLRRITDSGKKFYEDLLKKDQELIIEDLLSALENTIFGRNNFGCPDSNSDVEPPVVFVRAAFDLGYLTYKEFAYLLWKLEDVGGNYTDALQDIKIGRNQYDFDIPSEATKYTDAKPIMVLVRWGFLDEEKANDNSKHIVIPQSIKQKYGNRIRNLKIYNIDKNVKNYEISIYDEGEIEPKKYYVSINDKLLNLSNEELIDQLSTLLLNMYEEGTNKTTAIHMFGLKYADVIKEKVLSRQNKQEIINKAGIKPSLIEELDKGIRLYEAISNNEYGVSFYNDQANNDDYTITTYFAPRANTIFPLNSILYGAPGTGKTYATAKYAVAIVENKGVQDIEKMSRAELMGKYNKLIKEGQVVFTTFHQNYGYEDFIQGIRPNTQEDDLTFIQSDGIFKIIVDKAMKNPTKNYVVIIDEINRGNISKIFGELITLIEDDKRYGEENSISVTLPSGDVFTVPNNLYLVGTMNSADKSISLIDTALRRRFEFIEFYPDYSLVKDAELKEILKKINNGIVDELNSTDLLIGHSYFINKSMDDLDSIMNRSIIPLLYEYFFDNQKKVEALLKSVFNNTNYEVKSSSVGRVKLIKKGE